MFIHKPNLQVTKRHTIVLLMSLLFIMTALPVQAARMLCRSDPIVILSNGAIFDINAGIGTLPMAVKEVHYTLHGPVGTSAIAVISIPAWITTRETFQYVADQPSNTYFATVTVHTKAGNAAVVANATVITLDGISLGFYAVEGVEGSPITVRMR